MGNLFYDEPGVKPYDSDWPFPAGATVYYSNWLSPSYRRFIGRCQVTHCEFHDWGSWYVYFEHIEGPERGERSMLQADRLTVFPPPTWMEENCPRVVRVWRKVWGIVGRLSARQGV